MSFEVFRVFFLSIEVENEWTSNFVKEKVVSQKQKTARNMLIENERL